jgi:hypothetical protein
LPAPAAITFSNSLFYSIHIAPLSCISFLWSFLALLLSIDIKKPALPPINLSAADSGASITPDCCLQLNAPELFPAKHLH